MEKVKMDIPGPAYIVVPISENTIDRWLFNDAVDKVLGHNVSTLEELERVYDLTMRFFDVLDTQPDLADKTLPEPEEKNREVYREFHKTVFGIMTEIE